MITLMIILGLVIVIGLVFMSLYNGLIGADERAKGAWSGVEVQLKRRHDLVPALAQAVASATGYEKGIMDRIIKAREMAVSALKGGNVDDVGKAETQLAQGLKAFFSYAESNPQLTATGNIATFQTQLEDTEDQIAAARRYYNSAVEGYNGAVRSIPSNIVAGSMGMKVRSMIEFDTTERAAIQNVPEFTLVT